MKIVTFLAAVAVSLPAAGFASIITYNAALNGATESTSTGTGTAAVTVDNIANMMDVVISFSGLTSGTTASHIHCCTSAAGTGTAAPATTVPTLPGFPLGVTSGTYNHTFDLTLSGTYNPAFVSANGGTTAGAEAALLAGLAADRAYVNIHTTQFPGGEISGFLVAVPEPGTWLLTAFGIAAVGWRRRMRKLG